MGFRKKVIPKKDNYMKHRESSLSHIWPQHTKRISLKKTHNEVAIKVLPNNCDLPNSDKYTKHWQQLWREGRTHTPYKP